MRNGTYYLNNSGSRWVTFENGKKVQHTFATTTGEQVTRTLLYCFSFGNYVGAVISHKGKKIRVLMDTILEA